MMLTRTTSTSPVSAVWEGVVATYVVLLEANSGVWLLLTRGVTLMSVAGTATFMSRRWTLHRTVAPASLSGQSAFRANCSGPQPPGPGASCSMATLHVQNCTTLAMGLHDLQWQTQPFKNQRAEVFRATLNSRPVGAPCNTALVQGPEWERHWAWSAAHDWALRVILPGMLPLAWLSILG